MGYGLGAAMGAKTGRPEKTVVNIAGDGCFRMNMNEIATAVRHNIPVIEVVVNNHVLGMVRQWQDLSMMSAILRRCSGMPWISQNWRKPWARSGSMWRSQEEFKKAFADALKLNRPVVIDCQIGSDDKGVADG